jgi:4-amino-4-deoxy-L-arabinose transferase-like glycosyltransferase
MMRPIVLVAAAAAVVRVLLFAGVELYEDEAYYWLWSRHLAFGYFDHAPMVAWMIRASSTLLPGELGVRLACVICGALAVILAALIARELSRDERAPLIAALLAAAAPMLILTGGLAQPDAPATAAYALLCWCLCQARGPGWLLAGAAWGLALLSKYPAYFLAPGLAVLFLWDRTFRAELKTKWPWLGGVVTVLVFLPNLWWNAQHDFVTFTFGVRRAFGGHTSVGRLLELAGALLVGAGPIAATVGIVTLVRASTPAARRLAVAILVPIGCFAGSAVLRGIEPNWPALLYPGLCAAAAAALSDIGAWWRTRLVVGSVAFGCVLAAVAAAELRHPRLLSPDRPPLRRIVGGRDVAAKVHQVVGSATDHFIIPSRYQLAASLAFYGGWRRFGPSYNRPSQLDIWQDKPRPDEPIVVVSYERVDPAAVERLGLVGRSLDAVVVVEWRGRPLYNVGVATFAGQRQPPAAAAR